MTMATLETFVAMMNRVEVYDDIEGFHYWPVAHPLSAWPWTPSGICTNGAALVAKQFGGEVWGYLCSNNPAATLGTSAGGHDFALIGNKLVDWWALNVEGVTDRAVFDLNHDRELIGQLYGDRNKWVRVWPQPKETKL